MLGSPDSVVSQSSKTDTMLKPPAHHTVPPPEQVARFDPNLAVNLYLVFPALSVGHPAFVLNSRSNARWLFSRHSSSQWR